MFERFTEEARSVVVVSQEESRALRHNYVGTEHLLLGLLRLPRESAAAQVLDGLGVSSDGARERLRVLVPAGQDPTSGQIPFTPRAKRALERSLHEALARNDRHIGSEHILLAITHETEGMALKLLEGEGITPAALRDATEAALPEAAPRAAGPVEIDEGPRPGIRRSLRGPVLRRLPIEIDLSTEADRLLMSAAARALDDGRRVIDIADIEEALRRRHDADDPPQSATG